MIGSPQITIGATRGRGLEVGCGTGQWLPLLGGGSDRSGIGLDRSIEMLRQGRQTRGSHHLVQGDAGQLPFAGGSVGLIASVNALHHFPDPARYLREAARVLQSGGYLLLVGVDAHDPSATWYIYDFFDGTQARDRERYPRWDELRTSIRAVGLQVAELGVAHEIRQGFQGREVFEDLYLARNGTSQLALMSDQAYEQGRRRMRAAVDRAEKEGRSVEFRARLGLAYLLARREQAV